jgi:transposase InsO family protein
MGVRKIYHMLQPDLLEHGIKIGRDGLYNLLWQNGLLIRKRRRKITTNSNHMNRVYDNIIQDKQATGPNQIWVSDITYIPIKSGFVYLSLLTDAYSRKLLGYNVSRTLHTEGTVAALSMALRDLTGNEKLIHHSDRGLQYSSRKYTDILKELGITISMSRRGEPIDNAIAERINGIIKQEYLKGQTLDSPETAEKAIIWAIDLYNNERPHLSCGMLTPTEAHKGEIELTRLWKNKWKPTHYKYDS